MAAASCHLFWREIEGEKEIKIERMREVTRQGKEGERFYKPVAPSVRELARYRGTYSSFAGSFKVRVLTIVLIQGKTSYVRFI